MNDEDVKEILKNILGELSDLNKTLGHISHGIGKIGLSAGQFVSQPYGDDPTSKELKRIADFLLHESRDGAQTINSQEDQIKDLQQETLEIQLQQLKEQLEQSKSNNIPKYDKTIPAVIIDNSVVEIVSDTKENELCKVLLKDESSIKKIWNWDEVVEAIGEDPDNVDHKVVYRAGNRINQKVAQATSVKKLLMVKTKTIQVNPHLLK
jgi:hypothetical protein